MVRTSLFIWASQNETPLTLVEPPGYEFTLEYRLALNEWALGDEGQAVYFHTTNIRRFILRPLESARERRARLMQQLFQEFFQEFFQQTGISHSVTPWIERTERIFAENPDEVTLKCTCQHAGNLASQEILAQKNPHSYGCPMYKQDEVNG